MVCKNCGAPLQPNSPFCSACGTNNSVPAQQPAYGAQQPYGAQHQYGAQQPQYGAQPGYGAQPAYGMPNPYKKPFDIVMLFRWIVIGLCSFLFFTFLMPMVAIDSEYRERITALGAKKSYSILTALGEDSFKDADGRGFMIVSFILSLLTAAAIATFLVFMIIWAVKRQDKMNMLFGIFGIVSGALTILICILDPASIKGLGDSGVDLSSIYHTGAMPILMIVFSVPTIALSILVIVFDNMKKTKAAFGNPYGGAPAQQPYGAQPGYGAQPQYGQPQQPYGQQPPYNGGY
ncbi:MAG: zinc-ribbon domain-containing protein [Ruminococcus sp.]|nr:zinc-ribbon domain-containing protein [Ruminococcus sp.]